MSSVAAFMAFLVTVLFMFVLRPLAERVALVDVPGGRKKHDAPIPLIGGIAMCIGLTFGEALGIRPEFWTPLVLAIYLLVMVGTVDDRFDLSANVRLIAQACAAMLIVFGAELTISDLGAPAFVHIELGPAAVPFTILVIMTTINAFNMVDGIDGLAGGLSFLALAALAVIGAGTDVFALSLVLATVVAGFLLFNLPLAFNRQMRSFMGDAGSTFLGLAIATIGIFLSQGESARMAPVVGLWLIAVPVFDLFSAVIRRVMKGKSPFRPDNEHLHHAMVVNGLSRRGTLIFMISLAVVFAVVGVVGNLLRFNDGIMMATWVLAGAMYYQIMRRPKIVVRAIRTFKSSSAARPRVEHAESA